MIRVAVVCIAAGRVERGAENLAWYFKKLLPCCVEVYSDTNTDWTRKNPMLGPNAPVNKAWHVFIATIKKDIVRGLNLYRILYQVERIIPCFDVFSRAFLEHLSYGRNLMKSLERFKPDIIINISGSTVGYFINKYRKKYGIPFISVGGAGKNSTELKNARILPDAYITQTPSIIEFIKRKVPAVKIAHIAIGADLTAYNTAQPFNEAELKDRARNDTVSLEHPIILSTSALERSKRLDHLIRALKLLGKGTLLVTCDGSEKEHIVALGRKELGERFIYLGVLAKNEVPRIYKTCDIFCLPSIAEPFGNVLIEAMAANRPVVADDDEDRRWIVGEGGVLTDVRLDKNIADALRKAHESEWKQKPSIQAELFSWNNIMKQYNDLIEELTKER